MTGAITALSQTAPVVRHRHHLDDVAEKRFGANAGCVVLDRRVEVFELLPPRLDKISGTDDVDVVPARIGAGRVGEVAGENVAHIEADGRSEVDQHLGEGCSDVVM